MNLTLRALSALLSYPGAELQQHIDEVRTALRTEAVLAPAKRSRLEPLLRAFESKDLLDVQATYCELFDQSRVLSLHLFEHVHGDSRDRGQAMIDLGQQYIQRDFIMQDAELPDYLPMFLEFLSCLSPAEARDWLGQPVYVLAALEERLTERGSDYAAVFAALVALSGVKPDPEAVAELQKQGKSHVSKSIDQEWEEAPVDFSAPVQGYDGSGVVAKFKATREALRAAIKG